MEFTGPEINTEYQETYSYKFPSGVRGFSAPLTIKQSFKFVDWYKKQEVQEEYARLAEIQGLSPSRLVNMDSLFVLADMAICKPFSTAFSTVKAREMGFAGFVDSTKVIFETLTELEFLKKLPIVSFD